MSEKDEVIVPFAANDGVESEEEVEESPELDIERLNTLLETAESSLLEMKNERNKERILREKQEKEIVMLKGQVNMEERKSDELEGMLRSKEEDVEKERRKKQQAVARSEKLQAELDTLRRTKKALERQVEASEQAYSSVKPQEESDADSDGDTTD